MDFVTSDNFVTVFSVVDSAVGHFLALSHDDDCCWHRCPHRIAPKSESQSDHKGASELAASGRPGGLD